MKTIRLLYPDYVSGGLDTYYFGANLLAHILPENEKLTTVLKCITDHSDVVGLTIAEYLPFDEHRLHNMFSKIRLFTD